MKAIWWVVRAAMMAAMFVFVLGLAGSGSAAAQSTGTVEGLVVGDGFPIDGVVVDLFTAGPSGERLGWLDSSVTGAERPGTFSFSAEPGQYVLTYLAPPERSFELSGDVWLNLTIEVEQGSTVQAPDVSLGDDANALASGAVFQNFVPVEGVQVDLFAALADGSRGAWVNSRTTDIDGRFVHNVTVGCHILTFVAPDGDTFSSTNSPWFNRPFCVADGEFEVQNLDAELNSDDPVASILAQVVDDRSREPVAGATVDLFASDDTGARLAWLRTEVTDESGVAAFVAPVGCYVVTFVAPSGRVFIESGDSWENRSVCLSGQSPVEVWARLAPDQVSVFVVPLLIQNEVVIQGQPVDVFLARPDGSRGRWLGGYETHSGGEGDGGGTLPLIPAEACLVVTFRAPTGETFSLSGTEWLNVPACVGPEGGQSLRVEATLADSSPPEVIVDLSGGPVDFILNADKLSSGSNTRYVFENQLGDTVLFTVLGLEGGPDCPPTDNLRIAGFEGDTSLGLFALQTCQPALLRSSRTVDSIRAFVAESDAIGRYRVRAERADG